MPGTYRLILKRSFIFLNSLTAVIFLLTCMAPYLNPSKWWFFSILGLGFAFILVLLVGFVFFWLFVRPKYMLISLITLAIGWKSLVSFFGFDLSGTYDPQKEKGVIRVASWNVARFIELKRNNNKGSQTRLKMLDLIKAQNADVLCLQEFFHSTDSSLYNNLQHVQKKLGYPYYYYSWDGDGDKQWFGQIIFSRFPIVDSGKLTYPYPSQQESLIYADIACKGGDTVRFYTTHLQSVQFKKQDYESIEEIKNREDSLLENSKSIFSKLKRAVIYRSRQANIVREVTRQSPHPYVITGDFNDVPNSFTYFTIKGDLQDAFLQKGFGVGRTYSGLSPTLRIDYILPTHDFSVVQFNRVVREYSDHYLLVADLKLEK